MSMKMLTWLAFCCVCASAVAETTADITVRHAPYVVSTVSSKTEKDRTKCRYCGSAISFDRTYKWDVYNRKWVETTGDVPDTCRLCKSRDKDRQKLDRKEARLDREIEYYETKQRVDEKEKRLRRLRKTTR